jgi:excisionase family DNA binding protein
MTDTKNARGDLASEGACTITQAAKFTGLGRTTLYELMGAGQLPFAKVRGRRLIPRRALVELIERNLVAC